MPRAQLQKSSFANNTALRAQYHVAISGVVGFFVAMAIAFSRWPVPSMHDDFGNLLVASTLLEGRLANPVPAAWQSMETFHVILQPSYASKFPIGLGAMLAAGKLLFGSFAAGLWFSAAIASSSIAWMIAAHFPRRWAIAAGLMTATHPFWQNGWSQEFTNGWLAVGGTALVLGGLLRIRRRYRGSSLASQEPHASSKDKFEFPTHLTAIVGLGCVLVLFSRPFEGGLVCGLLGVTFIPTLIRRQVYLERRFWRATLPGAAILASGICFQLTLNRSITGQFLQLPYQLHETQYGVAPVMIWQKPNEPMLGHRFAEQVSFHYGWSMNAYNQAASFSGYFEMLRRRMVYLVNHWGQMLAYAPVGLLFLRSERRRLIGLIGLLLISILIINCIPWAVPQYVSPLIPVVIFIGCTVARGFIKRVGTSLQMTRRPIQLEYAAFAFLLIFNVISLLSIANARSSHGQGWEETWAEKRADMIRQLEKEPKSDIVFVRYPAGFDIVNSEWVFNEARVENSSVIWVRWGSVELNQQVTAAYPNHKVWELQFDEKSKPLLCELGF